MRFPVRTRGVAAGLAILAVGPFVALSGHGQHGVAQVRTPVAAAAVPAARGVDVVLQPRHVDELDAPPASAPPAPAPTPAVHHAVDLATATQAPASAPAAPAGSVEAIIRAAAARHGVSGDWMVKIARCESGLSPRAYNRAGPYIGLFQFLASTFRANGGTNIYDPADQSEIAARMLAHGQAHQWGCA